MTPEEIRHVYEAGPEAVIALVTRLLDTIARQSQQIAQLTERVTHLEAQIAKDSHNSSKPPTSDGLKRPAPKSLRQKSGKRLGGQPGHPGTTLCWSHAPDQLIDHKPQHCPVCGETFPPAETVGMVVERRQVQDLPPLRLVVTEHRVHACVCPVCRHETKAAFPVGVDAPVQYGPQIKALGVYLTCYQLLPFARSAQMLHDLFGASLSVGTLSAVQQKCSQGLASITQQIKSALAGARQAHFDETGARIAGRLHWLHVAATKQMTFYAIHPKRGREATEAIGILPAFGGRAIHDGWPTYLTYGCSHGLCNAHHLRELTFLAEQGGFVWAQAMKRLLQEMKHTVDLAKSNQAQDQKQGHAGLSPPVCAAFEERYTRLLEKAYAAHPPAPSAGKRGRTKQSLGYNLAERLRLSRAAVLAFLYDFSVPFDNNLAERDGRMMKLRLKISGGFRTEEGANIFCRIRGYLSTMLKQGHHALHVLTALLNGQTICPTLCT